MSIRLDLAESIRAPTRGPRRNPFETALAEAERQEAAAGPPAELSFSATILCVGITGVGKTATIHSILGLPPPAMGSFDPETKQVGTAAATLQPGLCLCFITCFMATVSYPIQPTFPNTLSHSPFVPGLRPACAACWVLRRLGTQ